MKNPVTRLKAILGELLHNGRRTSDELGGVRDRLAQLEEAVERIEVTNAGLRNGIAGLGAHFGELQSGSVRLQTAILQVQDSLSKVNHAFGRKPWPDLFDPYATDEIARRVFSLGSLLTPLTVSGFRKIRVGHQYDGGYVMIDDWKGITGAISIGVGDNDIWEREVREREINVAEFDHTIAAPPSDTPGIVWHSVGIGAADTECLRTLNSIIDLADFPSEGDLILKLDAEAAEWDALRSDRSAPLERFRQMVIEFHWFDMIADDDWFANALLTLQRISRSHVPIHVHANNGVSMMLLGGVSFPRVLEVTFVRRGVYTLCQCDEVFPTVLDAPCHPGRPDHFLGMFRFPVSKS